MALTRYTDVLGGQISLTDDRGREKALEMILRGEAYEYDLVSIAQPFYYVG